MDGAESRMSLDLVPVTTRAVGVFDQVAQRESEVVEAPGQLGAQPSDLVWDIVDEWGRESFPASDPPSNW
jgi:hypothetical protein